MRQRQASDPLAQQHPLNLSPLSLCPPESPLSALHRERMLASWLRCWAMPRVVDNQRHKWDHDPLLQSLSHEKPISYSDCPHAPEAERRERFLMACQEGLLPISIHTTGINFELRVSPVLNEAAVQLAQSSHHDFVHLNPADVQVEDSQLRQDLDQLQSLQSIQHAIQSAVSASVAQPVSSSLLTTSTTSSLSIPTYSQSQPSTTAQSATPTTSAPSNRTH